MSQAGLIHSVVLIYVIVTTGFFVPPPPPKKKILYNFPISLKQVDLQDKHILPFLK